MQILPHVYLVGSGDFGIAISHPKDCNVYLIDGGDGLTLIDAGVDISQEKIIKNIESHGFILSDIKRIIATHSHVDHVGGLKSLKDKTGATIMAYKDAARMISEGDEEGMGLTVAREVGFYPQDYKFKPCDVNIRLEDGNEFSIGNYNLKVIWTPGHSIDSICLYGIIDDIKVLFTADTVLYGGEIILQNIPGVSIQDYSWGVKRLSNLEIDALLPGHMLFTINRGQQHIDAAVRAFNKLGLPKSLI